MTSPPATNIVDAAALAEELARLRVIDPAQLTAALAEFPGGDPNALAAYLITAGLITSFQANRVLAGEGRHLILGPYRITQLLRHGNFGLIYSASDITGVKAYAARIFPLRSLWQVRVAKKLARSIASVPAHPVIVPLIDVDSASGFHYLIWPQVEGELLADRVRDSGPLPPLEAAQFLRQLAEALAVCHRRGIVHGLLTPRTVALGADGQPRLLEFGSGLLLARNLADAESMIDTLSFS